MALSPGQKKILLYGVPLVIVFVVVALYQKSKSSSSSSSNTGTTTPTDNAAIGAGDLANFENEVTSLFDTLSQQLSASSGAGSSSSTDGSSSGAGSSGTTTSTTTTSVGSQPGGNPTPSVAPSTLQTLLNDIYGGATYPSAIPTDVGSVAPANLGEAAVLAAIAGQGSGLTGPTVGDVTYAPGAEPSSPTPGIAGSGSGGSVTGTETVTGNPASAWPSYMGQYPVGINDTPTGSVGMYQVPGVGLVQVDLNTGTVLNPAAA